MPKYGSKFARAETSNNINLIQINSSINSSREKNKSLINKDTGEFYDGYIYSSSIQNQEIESIMLSINTIDFNENQSLFIWLFIPSVIIGDLTLSIDDGLGNSMMWNMSGLESEEANNYSLSFIDLIMNYSGKITRGWKLLEFSQSDANKIGTLDSIRNISISYSQTISQDENTFSAAHPFIAQNTSDKSAIISHQEYVIYAQKQAFVDKTNNTYVGDNIIIKTAKEMFVYVIIGKQNILDDSSGYLWVINLESPSGGAKTFTLDRQIEIDVSEAGIYLLSINLTTSNQDSYALLSESFNLFVEEFRFGYFQKNSYYFEKGSENMIVFTLSNDFKLEELSTLKIECNDKNIADATYYINNNKIYIKVAAKQIGITYLNISAIGTKQNSTENLLYEEKIKISVAEVKKGNSIMVLWIIFGILMTGFVVYCVISFVKSCRFGVK